MRALKKNSFKKLHFLGNQTKDSKEAVARLIKIYGQYNLEECDVIVALGGDGTILHALQAHMMRGKPFFGMNRGSVGFLMNQYHEEDLLERIAQAKEGVIHPLYMTAIAQNGEKIEALAINEVSLFRQSYQAAKIKISVDGCVRMEELICDGIMVASPAGSTAYNLSAFGPILPLMAPLMALTPVSAFRPRRWHGALLPNDAHVKFDILEPEKRPVNAAADNIELKSVQSVFITTEKNIRANLLFDANHSWEERILTEQFRY